METCHALAERGHTVHLVVRPDTQTPARDPFGYYGLAAEPAPRRRARAVDWARAPRGRAARRISRVRGGPGDGLGTQRHRHDARSRRSRRCCCACRAMPRSCTNRTATRLTSPRRCRRWSRPPVRRIERSSIASPDARSRSGRRADGYVTITAGLAVRAVAPLRAARASRDRARRRQRETGPGRRVGEDPLTVGYAGHLYPWKGVDVLLEALAQVPQVSGLIVGGHEQEPDLGRIRVARGAARDRRPRRAARGTSRRRQSRACWLASHLLALPNPPSALSTHATSPLKLFEYMAAGRADRRVRPALDSRSARARRERLARSRRATRRRLPQGVSAARRRPGAADRASRARHSPGRGVQLGSQRRAARGAVRRRLAAHRSLHPIPCTVRADVPIDSFRWSAAPTAGRPRRGAGDDTVVVCRGCGRCVRGAGRHLPGLAAGGSVRRADEVPRRGASRRRQARAGVAAAPRIEDPQRHAARVPAAGARRSRRRSRLRQRTRAAVESRPGRARRSASTSARSSRSTRAPRRAAAARRPAPPPVRRRDLHQGLVARRARAPVAGGAARHAARRRTGCSQPGGSLFVYTHVRKNAPVAAGLRWINRLARGLERIGLIDMRQERLRKSDHLNPLADVPDLERRDARVRVPHRAHHVLHADRRRLRREHPDAHGRARDGEARGAAARAARRRRRRRRCAGDSRGACRGEGAHCEQRGDLRGAARAVVGDEARPACSSAGSRRGPFFALLVKEPISPDTAQATRAERRAPNRRAPTIVRILYCAIDQTVPGTTGGSVHVDGCRRGARGARPRRARARDAGQRTLSTGLRALDLR